MSAPTQPSQPTIITTPEERRRGIQVLFLCLLSLGMGQTIFSALLPPIARDLGLNEIEVGLMFTLSAICWTVFSPVWGRVSDKIGRKPVVLIGMAGFAVSTASFGLILMLGIRNSVSIIILYTALVLIRAFYGVLGSGTPAAAQAYVADRTTRAERTKGVAAIGAAFGLGAIIGPGFAAVLAVVDLFLPFYLLGFIGFIGLIAAFLMLTERRRPEQFDNVPYEKLHLTDPRIRWLMIIGASISMVQAIIMQVSAFFILDTLFLSNTDTTRLVGIGLMGMAMTTLFSQMVIVPKFDMSVRAMLISGCWLLVISFGMFMLPMNETILVASMTISGFGFGLMRTGSVAGASLVVTSEEQGAVAGLIGSTAALGIILVPVTAMPLYTLVSPIAPYILGLLLSLVMLALVSGHHFAHLTRGLQHDPEV